MTNNILHRYKNHEMLCYFSDNLDGAPIKMGSKVKKVNSEKGDGTPDGTEGRVIGSLSDPVTDGIMEPQYLYAVVWDDKKDFIIGTIGKKLEVIG